MLQVLRDREYVSRWYGEHIRRFGDDCRSLGFNHRSSQEKRFEALCGLGGFGGRRLLDVGCGLGDFLPFLLERHIAPDYTGLDLCPEMIARCRERFSDHPGHGRRFEVGDALEYEPARKFDYVVASGIFGLRSEKAEERIAPTLARLFSWCRSGLAVNFLSSRARRQAPHSLYVEPEKMLSLAMGLTPAVELEQNYLPNDFTLFLYKTPAWERGPLSGF